MNDEIIERIRTEYIKALTAKKEAGDWHNEKTPTEVCEMMFSAIQSDANNRNYAGWLKHNQTLKKACKTVGVLTSPQLRELFIIGDT